MTKYDTNKEKKNIKINKDIHKDLKIYCAKNGHEIEEATNELILSFLKTGKGIISKKKIDK